MDNEQVCQFQANNAVGDLGVIETGLNIHSTHRKSLDSVKTGCVQLTKCEAHKSSFVREFKLLSQCVTHNINSDGNGFVTTLLHPLKVNIPEGSITAILGTADSGKSTLMKFIAGCLDKNVEWDGVGALHIER
jgi:ABC-type bacteriocin/lantibiotic exporter with double-glycine peptidase domain